MSEDRRLGVWAAYLAVVVAVPGAVLAIGQIGGDDGSWAPRPPTATAPTTTTPATTTTTTAVPDETSATLDGRGRIRSTSEDPAGATVGSEAWVEGDGHASTRAGPDGASGQGGGGMGAGGVTVRSTPPTGTGS